MMSIKGMLPAIMTRSSRVSCLLWEAERFSLLPNRVIRIQARYGSQFRMGEDEVRTFFLRWGLDHLDGYLSFPVTDHGFDFTVPKRQEETAFFVARLLRIFLINRGIDPAHIDVHIVVTEADYIPETGRYYTIQRFYVQDYLHRGRL